jgi:hypothetical protein
MMRYQDRYVYPFSLYSTHLRELVTSHQIDRLTNDIVAFDTSFNPHKNPDDLWSAVNRMLQNDSSSSTNSNQRLTKSRPD